MNWELRSIQPLRCANVTGLLYGLVMVPMTLLILPVFLFLPMAELSQSEAMLTRGAMVVLVMFYPVMGFVMGWIFGLLAAAIYNLIVKWIGGFRVRFDAVQNPATPAAPTAG